MTHAIIVLTTMPDEKSALKLAGELLEARLAACVNVLPQMTSVYEWKGRVETGTEHLLLIKSQQSCYPALETAIQKQHPYELPEIIVTPIESGLTGYLDWISTQTS